VEPLQITYWCSDPRRGGEVHGLSLSTASRLLYMGMKSRISHPVSLHVERGVHELVADFID
jgi:hypothetical protein